MQGFGNVYSFVITFRIFLRFVIFYRRIQKNDRQGFGRMDASLDTKASKTCLYIFSRPSALNLKIAGEK